MANTENVSVGKPYVDGAIYNAPKGTALPTDPTSTLSDAYVSLGFISDGGYTNGNSANVENVKAWGGKIVLTTTTEKPDTFTFTLIECTNPDVLKAVYGSDNVTIDETTGVITIRANSKDAAESVWVIDTLLHGKRKRTVIPAGKVSSVGDITYNDTDAVGYETTIDAMPYEAYDGDTHREYIEGSSDESE